jgi:hypothetical protein
MLEHVLTKDRNEDKQFGWAWQLRNLPEAPESRYLYTLLAGNDFQEGLKNYRTLVAMGGTLERLCAQRTTGLKPRFASVSRTTSITGR